MNNNLTDEAKRCLQCKNPRCSKGCPVGTPINKMINMFLDGKIKEAGEMLYDNNPLSVICSLVCPHERQCEGNCVRGIKGEPVHASIIENYISDKYLDLINTSYKKNPDKKIAIVGAGPAGICIALILAARGYDITIFEAHDKIGGVLMYGIPDFRLPKSILTRIKGKLIKMGVKIRPNTVIGYVLNIDDLFRDGYKAIFIGTGVWKPRTLGIKGESLGQVNYALDYLKSPDAYNLGNRVCVIGAGNVAMDAARTAARKGAKEVYIMYRKGIAEMRADKNEIEGAKSDGVKFELYKAPVEIVDEGVMYYDTSVSVDNKGNKTAVPVNGVKKLFEADSIIIAISQGPRDNIVSTTKGIDVDKRGLISTDEDGRTTREGVFASGDVVTGAKTVVAAVKLSKRVADAMDEYVTKKYNL